jgi:protein-S-isoprenylcysteine O-methyltransferase Ste14
MVRSGHWLFKWRSFLPLLTFGLVFAALPYLPHPAMSPQQQLLWQLVCLGVSCAGLMIRGLTVGFTANRTSGRNTASQVADALNTKGMYSLVRNPLYLGNLVMFLGTILFLGVWWLALMSILLFILYYERIIFAEEEFLRGKFGDTYLKWAEKTPMLIPRLPHHWQKTQTSFSFKFILKNEYQSQLGMITTFTLLAHIIIIAVEHRLRADLLWLGLMGASLLFYLVMRFLVKRTTLFSNLKAQTSP